MRTHRGPFLFLLILLLHSVPGRSGPTVVPTAEGQVGLTPAATDEIVGVHFETIRGQVGDVLLGGLVIPTTGPARFDFTSDRFRDPAAPLLEDTFGHLFTGIAAVAPGSAQSRSLDGDSDFVAFSFAIDGAMPDTMTVRIATFDENGMAQVDDAIETVSTFPFPDPAFARTGVAVDNQGRATVVYTDLPGATPAVKAARIDAVTGAVINAPFTVNPAALDAGVALLDPAGDRLIVPSIGPGGVQGNIIDFSGGTPTILPTFPVDTGAETFVAIPVVATDPLTGVSTIVWEGISGDSGNPVDVRARRFDAQGNPIGGDFVVNSTTSGAQGQARVAYSRFNSQSAVVWATDQSGNPLSELDVFAQAYDADGNPIGGETQVNTDDMGAQDRPAVRFLPTADSSGRAEFAVLWRDVEAGGTPPRGTGVSYKCFSIDGLEDPAAIFADGFESGDTSSWCANNNP